MTHPRRAAAAAAGEGRREPGDRAGHPGGWRRRGADAPVGGGLPVPAEGPAPPRPAGGTLTPEQAAELAQRYGLQPSARRPPLLEYARAVWQRRHFVVTFATSRNIAQYSGARLGQIWQVLTPLFNAAVYFLLFGLLLKTDRGISNFTGYLTTGVFIFYYTQRSVMSGVRAISGNLSLIRALHFPRAVLPLSYTLVELQQLLYSMVVLMVIVVLTGEPVQLMWLTLIPLLVVQTFFNIGLSMFMARVGAENVDIAQLMPFLLRTWLYMSGIFYSIHAVSHGLLRQLLLLNPAASFAEIARLALLRGYEQTDPHVWLTGGAWAAVMFVLGFWYFWRGEERYGRG